MQQFAVLISKSCNPELLSFLEPYVFTTDKLSFIKATKIDHIGGFVEIQMIESVEDKKTCGVLIPHGCVLGIVDLTNCKPKIGFSV